MNAVSTIDPKYRTHSALHATCLAGVLVYCCLGCTAEQKGGPRVGVIPVTGKLLVDGKPVKGVIVDFYRVSSPGVDFAVPNPQGQTDENGMLSLSTYVRGDGGAPGEYKLVFELADTVHPITGDAAGDAFKGKFRNPQTSKHTVTIAPGEGGKPCDLGTIELTTK